MKNRIQEVLHWRGVIGRHAYLSMGIILFALKFAIDWLVATVIFKKPWTPYNYVKPSELVGGIVSLDSNERNFYLTMAATAVPFIWVGVGLTLQRLRDAGLPLWLVIVFFAPMPINLIFFVVLACLSSKLLVLELDKPGGIGLELDPEFTSKVKGVGSRHSSQSAANEPSTMLQGFYTLGVVLPVSLALMFFSVRGLRQYGWGVFLGIPFAGPMTTVILFGLRGRRSFGQCMAMGLLWVVGMFFALLITAFEGAVCLIMMLPILLPISLMGALVGYAIQAIATHKRDIAGLCLALAFLLPGLMGAEVVFCPPAPIFEANTTIEIDAPPEVVWNHVVSFSELPPPDDWLFQTGIAYPVRAEISGHGPGAIRRCIFSTGPFVEPIEIWDEPRLLRFKVTSCPAPMREWNPFYEIDPPHLQNFLVARRGEFRLIALPGGRTRLEGTTWYQHHMWPAGYWQVWSSPIIERIHMQVLKHIKRLAELEAKQ